MTQSRPSAPPDRSSHGTLVSALGFFLPIAVCAALYARTICPTIFWGDGMELAAAAKCLGIAHPTGYPLYTLLGHIFLEIPIGGPGLRMNLLSAVSMLTAVGLLHGLAGDILRLATPAARGRSLSGFILQSSAAAIFGLSSLAWMHATQTEVYATLVAILLGCFRLLIRAYERRSVPDALALAFLTGIAFQSHMLAVILLPPLAIVILRLVLPLRPPPPFSPNIPHALSREEGVGGESRPEAAASDQQPLPLREGRGEGRPSAPREPLTLSGTPPTGIRHLNSLRLLLLAPLFFAIGLSGYLALPIRARANPPMNWGDPSTPARFIAHLRGGEYTDSRFLNNPSTSQPIRGEMLRYFLSGRALDTLSWADPTRQPSMDSAMQPEKRNVIIGGLFWLGAAIGWGFLARGSLLLSLGLAGTVALSVGIYLCYVIADIDVYFLSLSPLLLVFFWTGLYALASRLRSRAWRRGLSIVSALAVAGVAAANYRGCDLSAYTQAEQYAHNLLAPLEKGAILITSEDSAIFAAWYEQTVNGGRPDVIVFGANFQFREWYARYFERPEAEGLAFFTANLRAQLQADMFVAIGGGIIIPNLDKRPIYVATPDDWLRVVLIKSWNGVHVADLFPVASWRPLPWADPPAASIYRLRDNPEFRKYQEGSFETMFGNLWPKEKRGGFH